MSKLDKSTIAWKKKRFDEVAVIANGQVDPRIEPYCREIHIGPENIESHTGRIINLQKAEELGLISGKYVFDENSIIYSKIRPNLNKLCQPSFRGICSADMYPIWAKEEINKSYLYYFMQSPAFYNQAIKSSMRTGIPKINRQDLNRVKITYPVDHAIQNRIVNTISVWDNAIEKTEALIAAKEKQFEWLTQSLISKKCSDWKHYLARELFTGVSSKGHPEEELLSVTQDQGVVPRSMLSGRVMSPAGSTAGYKLVEKGNFVISLRSFQGGLEYSDYCGIVSPAYTVLSSKKKIHSGFYRHFFKSYIFIEKYLSVAVIGIRDGKQISSTDFDTIKIPYPDMDEQVKIASKLDTARQEIDLLKDILEKYRCQKRGLMQKLLTGEWQVGSSQHLSEETCQELSRENVA
ncbi:restriction endonuclease subunit S [Alteromonas sp. a30]|uniref:restriction endonuclease subunit S n=1 Tax=Alteromonas sp. a30 TaxID=2730917 RepID=UPI0022807BF6|nr:restriction endonuclease subunit S [Alteromonas sp. a30]